MNKRCFHDPETRRISMLIRELFTKSPKHAMAYEGMGSGRVWRLGELEICLCRGCELPFVDCYPWPLLDEFQMTLFLITEIASVSGSVPEMSDGAYAVAIATSQSKP